MTAEGNGEVILATGGYDHTVKIWNAKSGVNLRTYQHPNTVSFNRNFAPKQGVNSCKLGNMNFIIANL